MYTPRPADLIFVRGSGPIDRLIEIVSRSPYSHVAGLVKPNELIEAQGLRKTGYQGLDFYDGCSDIYTCDSLTDEQRQGIVDFVTKQVGTKYDYGLIAWEAVHFLLHIDCPYSEGKRHDCSTLWNDAYKSVGINLRPDLKYPSPGELAQSKLLKKVGSF